MKPNVFSLSEYETISAAARQVKIGFTSHYGKRLLCLVLLVDQQFVFKLRSFSCLGYFRSNSHLSSAVPPLRLGQISSHHLLSELSAREKNLRKMLEGKQRVIMPRYII